MRRGNYVVLICAPTLTGREGYLRNMFHGYLERSGCAVEFACPKDLPSCGEGWNAAVESHHLNGVDFIHFSNDDVVPAVGWENPLILEAKHGCLPACRMEPAEYRLGIERCDPSNPPMPPLPPPAPDEHSYYYADLPENQPTHDRAILPEHAHGALPFMSVEQWRELGPFIPIHFGTDKWICHRAREAGYTIRARTWSVMFNYAAPVGRTRGDWTEQDFLDFDLNIAYPLYIDGQLKPTDRHPSRGTAMGLAMARAWRRENVH
jgi:hypothetical protein